MRWWGIAVLACACGPVVDIGADATSGDASTTGGASTLTTSGADEHATVSDEVTTVQPDPPPPVTTDGESTTSTNDPSADFILNPDGGTISDPCDPWAQDCPRGEKCMPWANDGGHAWNDTRCSPIAEDPREVGESCTVEGSGVSGIDDCVISSMCWNVDPETNMGECVGFCQGSEANPTCADPCTECTIYSDGTLILCYPACDPLAQDCGEGQACYPTSASFTCSPDAGGDEGAIGEPCEYLNVCDPGSYCAGADLVPGCEGASGCCTPFCDVEQPDTCDVIVPGTVCTPWYEDGQEPGECLGMGTVGACIDAE
jgi:hypothetical protein